MKLDLTKHLNDDKPPTKEERQYGDQVLSSIESLERTPRKTEGKRGKKHKGKRRLNIRPDYNNDVSLDMYAKGADEKMRAYLNSMRWNRHNHYGHTPK